ncbi:sodium:solute symporter family protein [Haloarcula laminariae]|uniref:sodium:solute symporter family protein n=1 Tax=Haloarcula laminariae TaxID=2961577 RepID=UPI00240768E5|nr:sodium:solute symporter family protein [Halomicroarcula sp. FL173]
MVVSNTVLGIVAVYILAILGIGLYASKYVKTGDDFMLAGKRLGPVFIAGTVAATEIGGGSSIGVAEQSFGDWGLSSGWYVLTMAIAFVVLAFLAPRLRSTLTTTVSEFFKRRFGTANHVLTAVVLLLPMIGLTAVQIIASGIILSIIVGIEYQLAVVIMGTIAVGYSVVGGLWSVTLTDLAQWILVIAGVVITVPFALQTVGGWGTMQAELEPWRFSLTQGIGWRQIISLTVVYITSFSVGQEYIQRYFAAESDRAAKLGSLGAAGTYALFAFVPAILGLAALTYQQQGNTVPFVAEYGTRYVLPGFATVVLPDIILGILFGALVSATMSSADSDLVAASTIVVNDLYEEYINPDASPEKLGRLTKIVTGVIGVSAIGIALFNVGVIVELLLFSFSFRAAGIFVPYIGSHFWDGGSSVGSFLAISAGSAVVGLEALGMISFGAWQEPVIPGLLLSLVCFVGGSYAFPDDTTPAFIDKIGSSTDSSASD